MSRAGVGARLLAFALFYLSILPFHLVALRFDGRLADWLPVLFHRVFLRLFDVRVSERGRPPDRNVATLVLANHVSWLDIPVIGSLHPLLHRQVGDRRLAAGRILRPHAAPVFLDRQRRRATAEVNHAVAHRLRKGDAIVLFAEGTTSDGNRLLPFRSSLVGAAQAALADPASAESISSRSRSPTPPQRPADHPPGASGHRLVRRHGTRAAPEPLRARGAPRRGRHLGRSDPVRRRPEARHGAAEAAVRAAVKASA